MASSSSYTRNTLVFLDTNFFKSFEPGEGRHEELLEMSRLGDVVLCTSRLCLEEWRSQKIEQYLAHAEKWHEKTSYLRRVNLICFGLLEPDLFIENLMSDEAIDGKTAQTLFEFTQKNKIQVCEPLPDHIIPTWKSYFRGKPPFRGKKSKKDIPDAWIFEGARHFFGLPELQMLQNKVCISSDEILNSAMQSIGYEAMTLNELLDRTNGQEKLRAAVDTESGLVQPQTQVTGLESLMALGRTNDQREIYSRLAGFVGALDTSTHETIIELVAGKGFDIELIKACAQILSQEPGPVIRNTGSHYLPGDKKVCSLAAAALLDEINSLVLT